MPKVYFSDNGLRNMLTGNFNRFNDREDKGELLENYVKPAVEMDGGAIQFRSYDDGVVNLMLQGSCSGCPSSMITLKAGIEGMMKRMIPEVKEVVAEAE